MKLSIIIPAYNDLAAVLTCLNSLQALASKQSDYEWLVQDDCGPAVFLPAVIPPAVASVERNGTNLGFSGNCNAGAARATGDVLLFVNQDVYGTYELSKAWDAPILNAFAGEGVAVVGPKLLFPDGRVQSAGGIFDGKCQPTHRYIGWSNAYHPAVNTPECVPWVTGAVLAVRRDVWQHLGGFDGAYLRGYFEDVDFCVRAQLAGFKVWYEPRAVLVHQVGTSGGNPEHFMHNARIFKARYVDTGMIAPDEPVIRERFW